MRSLVTLGLGKRARIRAHSEDLPGWLLTPGLAQRFKFNDPKKQ